MFKVLRTASLYVTPIFSNFSSHGLEEKSPFLIPASGINFLSL